MKQQSMELQKYGAAGFSRASGVICQPGIVAFCAARIVIDMAARITVSELYREYREWFPGSTSAAQKATRRVFTVGVQRCVMPFDVEYCPMWHERKTARGFIGIRLVTALDRRLDDIPEGPLAVVRDLLAHSMTRRVDDAAYIHDISVVQDLLLTVNSVAWSRTVARNILDDYAEIYPELDTVLNLFDKIICVSGNSSYTMHNDLQTGGRNEGS